MYPISGAARAAMFTTLLAAATAVPQSRILIDGKAYFFNGMNMAWNRFGSDLEQYDAAVFDDMFKQLSDAGGNSVRWWLHCDGRQSPGFDGQGRPSAMPASSLDNLERMLDQAASHGIRVMPAIWSFDMANAGHANIVKDTAYTGAYIRNVLDPMVRRFAGHSGLLAWEICNEPEWMLDDDGSTNERVTKQELQRFHGLMAAAIHRADPKALVTTGSASYKWCSTAPSPVKGHYYSDEALRGAAGGDELAYLDFYQIHYYSWMRADWGTYSPWDKPLAHWGLDKPVIIGELPAKGQEGYLSATEMYVGALDSGYAGIMSWAFLDNRADKEGTFADTRPGLQAVAAKAPTAIAGETTALLPAVKPVRNRPQDGSLILASRKTPIFIRSGLRRRPDGRLVPLRSRFD